MFPNSVFSVLTEHTQAKIDSEKTRLEKCQALLDTLQRQGIPALSSFIEALRDPFCGYEWLANELNEDYKKKVEKVHPTDG